jgi:hypothetical protein
MARLPRQIVFNDAVVDEKFEMEIYPPYLSTAILTLPAA